MMLDIGSDIDLEEFESQLESIDTSIQIDIAKECRYDLFAFINEFWEVIIEEEPIWNWHIPYICKQLEEIFYSVVMRKPRKHDLIINIPPGTTKSTIMTMFQCWCWIARLPKDKFPRFYERLAKKKGTTFHEVPELQGSYFRFITGSYATPLSLEHSEYALTIITSEKYTKYFPEIQLNKRKAAKSNFVNTHKGQRFTTSVGSTVTGVHAHIIIIDDPIDPNQSISDKERLTANHWTDQTLSTRKVDKRVTVTITIMQRLHLDDPTGHLMSTQKKKQKIKHIVLPATLEYEVKPPELADNYTNGYLDAVRLNKSVCEDFKEKLGAYGYSGQFGQDPVPKEGAMFQEEWFEIVDSAPARVDKRVRGWDLAGTSEAEAAITRAEPAYTAGVLISQKGSTFYVEHVYRKRVSSKNMRKALKNLASQDSNETIIDIPQDPGQAGKDQVRELVAMLVGHIVKFSVESGDKLVRLGPFASQCEAGNVKLVRGPWNREYLDELIVIPLGKYRDQADATSRAFKNLYIPGGRKAGTW